MRATRNASSVTPQSITRPSRGVPTGPAFVAGRSRSPSPKAPSVTGDYSSSEGSREKEPSLAKDLLRWTPDILSLLFACMALVAILITLMTHDNRVLPDWPLGISVNALVSVFATLWKASMLSSVANAISQLKWSWFRKSRPLIDLLTFDDASRGTFGSLWLIGRLRAMHLASLGAVIFVLALAGDPFIQQVVDYKTCRREVDNATATVARSNVYTDSEEFARGASEFTLSFAMQAALYKGAYDSFSPVTPTCASGNCTFPDYRAVGMCSRCEDVSASLSISCSKIDGPPGKMCHWKLPSNLTLTVIDPVGLKVMVVRSQNEVMHDTRAIADGIASTTEIISLTNVLDYNRDEPFEWEEVLEKGPQNVMALNCTLWPCVQTYSIDVAQGQATEKLVATHGMTYEQNMTSPIGHWDAAPMPCLIDGSYYNADSFEHKNASDINEVFGLLPNNASAWLPDECLFSYTNPLGMIDYLPTFLRGHVFDSVYGSYARPSWMGQLFHNDSATLATVNQTWANMAAAMTMHMRQAGVAGFSEPARGTTWQTETCIAVRWAWLTFPAALMILTAVLLVCTIVESVRLQPGRIWKASPLALLFHGLSGELQEGIREVCQATNMDAIARRLVVTITEDSSGVGLAGYTKEDG